MLKANAGYITYSTTGTGAVYINAHAPDRLDELQTSGSIVVENFTQSNIGDIVTTTAQNTNWIAEMFPEAVAEGTIVVTNGSVYIGGIAMSELISLIVGILSIVAILIQAVTSLSAHCEKVKTNNMEKENERKQAENLAMQAQAIKDLNEFRNKNN